MSENQGQDALRPPPREGIDDVPHAGTPITRQLRAVGQRRREAELKLEQHLQEARHKDEPHRVAGESLPCGP